MFSLFPHARCFQSSVFVLAPAQTRHSDRKQSTYFYLNLLFQALQLGQPHWHCRFLLLGKERGTKRDKIKYVCCLDTTAPNRSRNKRLLLCLLRQTNGDLELARQQLLLQSIWKSPQDLSNECELLLVARHLRFHRFR